MTVRKLCRDCFSAEFPGKTPGMMTWARECSTCHKPTPSFGTLVKVGEE